jgi:Tfp pilus assembly protein PilV
MTDRMRKPTVSATAGIAMIEVMVALVLIAVGVLALMRMMPTSTRVQNVNRMQETAVQFVDEEFEALRGLDATSAALSVGRHPAVGFESLGTSGAWHRFYTITPMGAPIGALIKLETTVTWNAAKPESLRMTGYLMP